MNDAFDRLIEPLISREGGYSNNPADSGGETIWGITKDVARANGYSGPMQLMTRDQARAIYRKRYWSGPGYDHIASISEPIAEELFDTGVNAGPKVASRYLQRALNLLNRGGADYPELVVDGVALNATREALRAFLQKRGKDGERVLLRALNAQQGAFYMGLAENRPKDEAFLYGWLLNRVT